MRHSRLLGALLVLLGLSGSALPLEPTAQPIDGQVQFANAYLAGETTLTAGEGSLLVEGAPTYFGLMASTAELTVVTVAIEHVNNPAAGDVAMKVDEQRQSTRLTRLSIELPIVLPNSVIYAFSNDSSPELRFRLPLGNVGGTLLDITTEPVEISVGHAGQSYAFSHLTEAPAFGVGSRPSMAPFTAAIPEAQVSGDFAVAFDNAVLEVASAEGVQVIETGEHEAGQTGVPSFQARYRTERSYALLQVVDGNLTVTPGDADARFLSTRPAYHVDGSSIFVADRGRLQLNQTAVNFESGTLRLTGNMTIRPTASLASPLIPTQSTNSQSSSQLQGDVTHVTMNGRAILLDLPAVVREASLLVIILGVLVGAWTTIQKVTAPFLLPLYARLTRKDILSQKHRDLLYREIRTHPFIHLRELERRLGIGYGTASYHLSVLRKEGLVFRVNGHKDLYYVPRPGFSHDSMRRLATLAEPGRERVATCITKMGRCSQTDLRGTLGLTKGAVSKTLAQLTAAGLVHHAGPRPRRYEPSALLLNWLAPVREAQALSEAKSATA